ncbi:alpha/beta hydrolase [Trichocoleus desertorum AS-A10]|uniref:alpha/beta fold hydrolase n=1 Tax=Trichocoleus desertorum TaxID=1481672 RepID=UPI003297D302
MPYIPIRGVNHYYEWIGTSDHSKTSGKPIMVFVHGWGGSARYWESTAQALSDTFDCLLYDLRGFGRSCLPADQQPGAENQQATLQQSVDKTVTAETELLQAAESTEDLIYELESYADDLAALLRALGLERVYLNAHSMGASIAVFFLNLYPQFVERAILTCSGIFEYDEKAFSAFYRFGGYVVKFRPRWLAKIPFANRMFMARFLHKPLPDAISQAFLEDFLLADYKAALGTIFTSVSKKATEVMPREFTKLTVPTLLIAGEHDIIIPASMGQQAADLNEKVEYSLIPSTAHFPMMEDPETYLQRVRDFTHVKQPSL